MAIFAAAGLEACTVDNPVTYQRLEFHTPSDQHGNFDNSTGLFVASRPGLYLFFFNGTSWQTKTAENTQVELRVDGLRVAATKVSRAGRSDSSGYTLSISAMLQLNSGNRVGIFVKAGALASYRGRQDSFTRFSCILLSKDEDAI